jgi:hypothetical protein
VRGIETDSISGERVPELVRWQIVGVDEFAQGERGVFNFFHLRTRHSKHESSCCSIDSNVTQFILGDWENVKDRGEDLVRNLISHWIGKIIGQSKETTSDPGDSVIGLELSRLLVDIKPMADLT